MFFGIPSVPSAQMAKAKKNPRKQLGGVHAEMYVVNNYIGYFRIAVHLIQQNHL